jgi:hypothetical protein
VQKIVSRNTDTKKSRDKVQVGSGAGSNLSSFPNSEHLANTGVGAVSKMLLFVFVTFLSHSWILLDRVYLSILLGEEEKEDIATVDRHSTLGVSKNARTKWYSFLSFCL